MSACPVVLTRFAHGWVQRGHAEIQQQWHAAGHGHVHSSHGFGIWKAISVHQIFVEGYQTRADDDVTSSNSKGLCHQAQLSGREHGAAVDVYVKQREWGR